MKQLILLCLLITCIPICYGQEEIFFNDINIDKKEIKVAKLISGFDFNSDFIRILPGTYSGYGFGSVETKLSYFLENRIGNTWALNKSIGIGNSLYPVLEYFKLQNGTYISGNEVNQYILSMEVKLEPRWYFDQRLRYKHNKNTRNNSGWFLSLPLTLSTDLLQQPVAGHNSKWLPEHFNLRITAPITIGYRNAFAKKWFMEVSAGYIPFRAWFYDGSFYSKSANKIGIFSADSFNSELKIAYTF